MNYHACLWLATLVLGASLSGCAKEPEPAAPAAAAQNESTPAPGETIANEAGTTTYFGSGEEQSQPANN